jgi:hypothetical protein
LITGVIFLILAASAEARNDKYYLSNTDVINDPGFKQLGTRVAFYFAGQASPKIAQDLGTFTANKIAKIRGQSDEQLCQQAALGALSELRDEASARSGNAVVNIQSLWKGNTIAGKTKYESRGRHRRPRIAARNDRQARQVGPQLSH